MSVTTDAWMSLNLRPEVRMTRGEGSLLWDHNGKRYLDFIQGWAVNCLGHNPEVVRRAVNAQLEAVINVGPACFNEPALKLTYALSKASGLDKVFLASSGVEANEAAVKLARKWGQKHRAGAYEVITTLDSFHGRTLAMTCATGKPGFEQAFPPKVEGFPKVPYGDLDALKAAIHAQTVAIMVEPIQGEAGAVVPPSGYLKALRALCDERGILLILDEIQTGMARTGPLFAYQGEGILPDILTLGKGLGGGMPLSAMLSRAEVMCFEHGDHGSTFGGHAVCSAAGLAVLETLQKPEHVALRKESSLALEAALKETARILGGTLRGSGHLWGIVLDEPRALQIRDRAFELGLLVNAARPNVLRFMPALDVGPPEIDSFQKLIVAAAQ